MRDDARAPPELAAAAPANLIEARYRALVEATAEIVWTCSRKGEVRGEQPSWTAFTGQSRADYEGFGWLEAVHPDDRTATRAAWRRANAARAPYRFEQRVRRRDGVYCYFEVRAAPILGADGRPCEWVGLHIDMTRRHEGEEALRRSEAELAALLAREHEARLVAERATAQLQEVAYITQELLAQRTVEGLLHELLLRVRIAMGVDTAAVLLLDETGTHLRVRVWSGVDDEPEARIAIPVGAGVAGRIAATRQPAIIPDLADVEVADPVLRQRLRSLLGVPLVVADRLVGVMHVGAARRRDFTAEDRAFLELVGARAASAIERQRLMDAERAARASAEAADRAKSEFLAMISHELRTPLNAIRGYAQIMADELYGPLTEKQRVALERISASERHLVGIITDLLDHVRLEAGRLPIAAEAVPIRVVVDAAEALVRPQYDTKGVALTRTPCPSDARVRGDERRISQIAINLLSNALKFTEPGGAVVVECEAHDERVLLHVRDTGCGIPRDECERIFHPFVQAPGARTRSSKGIGLGLTISRELARGMGGELRVESTVGQGSTFTLELPRERRAG